MPCLFPCCAPLEVPHQNLGYAMVAVRFVCMLGFYGGVVGVLYSIFVFEAPAGPDATIPVSPTAPAPAIKCTMILTIFFFGIQLAIALCRSYTKYTGKELARMVGVMNAAANTVKFAPMLAIVFLACACGHCNMVDSLRNGHRTVCS